MVELIPMSTNKSKSSQSKSVNVLQTSIVRLSRIYFTLTALYALVIIVSDAWDLITPEMLLNRWEMAAVLLGVTAIVWFLARRTTNNALYYKILLLILVILGIGFATFSVYTQRGMASKGVMLYVLPIITAAALYSRSAVMATATVSVAAYTLAAVRYFVLNPAEGYKVELYTEIGFYSGLLFIVAALVNVGIRALITNKK